MSAELEILQRWLTTAITCPGELDKSLARAQWLAGLTLADVVRSSAELSAEARVGIYARGYLARLLECMRADFPATRSLVGDALFDRFAAGYLWTFPPRGYSMFRVGERFADYLERTRPPDDAAPPEHRAFLDLPIDLARVERARLEALRAPGIEGRDDPSLPSLLEAVLSTPLSITASPCLRIVGTRHDVRAFIDAVDRGQPPTPPELAEQTLAIARMNYRPTLTLLEPWQQLALERCTEAQTPTQLAAAIANNDTSPGAALADIAVWLPVASARGLVLVARTS